MKVPPGAKNKGLLWTLTIHMLRDLKLFWLLFDWPYNSLGIHLLHIIMSSNLHLHTWHIILVNTTLT